MQKKIKQTNTDMNPKMQPKKPKTKQFAPNNSTSGVALQQLLFSLFFFLKILNKDGQLLSEYVHVSSTKHNGQGHHVHVLYLYLTSFFFLLNEKPAGTSWH